MMSYIKILKEHRFQRLQGCWTGLALRPGELGNYAARKRFTFKPFRDTGICNPSKLDHKTPQQFQTWLEVEASEVSLLVSMKIAC